MWYLALVLLVVLDCAAMVGALAIALKLQKVRLAAFFRAMLGGVAAIPVEIVRIFAAFGLVKLLGVSAAGGENTAALLFLLNFRFVAIPAVVIVGFFVAMQSE